MTHCRLRLTSTQRCPGPTECPHEPFDVLGLFDLADVEQKVTSETVFTPYRLGVQVAMEGRRDPLEHDGDPVRMDAEETHHLSLREIRDRDDTPRRPRRRPGDDPTDACAEGVELLGEGELSDVMEGDNHPVPETHREDGVGQVDDVGAVAAHQQREHPRLPRQPEVR